MKLIINSLYQIFHIYKKKIYNLKMCFYIYLIYIYDAGTKSRLLRSRPLKKSTFKNRLSKVDLIKN